MLISFGDVSLLLAYVWATRPLNPMPNIIAFETEDYKCTLEEYLPGMASDIMGASFVSSVCSGVLPFGSE